MLVSIVTPSLQQGRFLERTLESVWRQRASCPRLEHIVMDGGSTDNTREILDRWRERIAFRSEPDEGQTAAINAGMMRARGDVLAYLNSDDIYFDHAVATAVDVFKRNPSVDVIYGDAACIDCDDRIIGHYPVEPWSPERLRLVCFLSQPAVFFRRRVWERFGSFDPSLQYCMDYEYWLRLAQGGAYFVHVPARLAGARIHPESKTMRASLEAHAETLGMLRRRLGTVPDNWLWNYAFTALDARGLLRRQRRPYLARIGYESIRAALRWNGVPSFSLLQTLGSWYIRGRSTVDIEN